MKNSRQNIVLIMAIVISLIFCASYGTAGDAKEDAKDAGSEKVEVKATDNKKVEVSDTDEEGFILYKYSMIDAKKGRSSKIVESTDGDKTTYTYNDHALSCGTVMTGSIIKTKSEKSTHVVGDFKVGENTYDITKLSFEFDEDESKKRVGTMTVQGKVVDMQYFNYK